MAEHDGGTIIEGIGDDLIFGMMLSTIVALPLVTYCFIYWLQRSQTLSIHPLNADVIEETRSRLAQRNAQSTHSSSANMPAANHRVRTDRTCPICLSETIFGIETNCGHLFCGECIVTCLGHGNWLSHLRCPVCRQKVTLLLQNFTDADHNSAELNRQDIMNQINRYNRRFSGQPIAWLDYIRDLPTLLRHAMREVFTVSGLLLMYRLRIVVCFIFALLYFISPLDLIPEAVFGILGLLDDFFIVLLLSIYVTVIYRQAIMFRSQNNTE